LVEPILRRREFAQLRGRVRQQRRDLRALERDGGALGVVFVVADRVRRRRHDLVEVAPERLGSRTRPCPSGGEFGTELGALLVGEVVHGTTGCPTWAAVGL
jgi:hypothetical protein